LLDFIEQTQRAGAVELKRGNEMGDAAHAEIPLGLGSPVMDWPQYRGES
jgi:hypothetical protein